MMTVKLYILMCCVFSPKPDNKNYDDKATALIYLMYLEQWFLFTIFTFEYVSIGKKTQAKRKRYVQHNGSVCIVYTGQ